MDDVSAAKTLIASLDLTSLNDDDTDETIGELCAKALTPAGKTAAVCVYPRFIPTARADLPADIKIATVINFPAGLADIGLMEKEIASAVRLGADELDVVLPYRALLGGDIEFCTDYLTHAREACAKKTLKIIIETGELKTVDNIRQAAILCINASGNNFPIWQKYRFQSIRRHQNFCRRQKIFNAGSVNHGAGLAFARPLPYWRQFGIKRFAENHQTRILKCYLRRLSAKNAIVSP